MLYQVCPGFCMSLHPLVHPQVCPGSCISPHLLVHPQVCPGLPSAAGLGLTLVSSWSREEELSTVLRAQCLFFVCWLLNAFFVRNPWVSWGHTTINVTKKPLPLGCLWCSLLDLYQMWPLPSPAPNPESVSGYFLGTYSLSLGLKLMGESYTSLCFLKNPQGCGCDVLLLCPLEAYTRGEYRTSTF